VKIGLMEREWSGEWGEGGGGEVTAWSEASLARARTAQAASPSERRLLRAAEARVSRR
jgi:hypothetical protein